MQKLPPVKSEAPMELVESFFEPIVELVTDFVCDLLTMIVSGLVGRPVE